MAAVFVAQMNHIALTPVQLVTLSVAATLASGAATASAGGMMTMVMVLSSVGLPVQDVTIVIAVDFLLGRLRTTLNVLGDAVGSAIVDHYAA